ncbi:hypothetical protein [Actinomycetospora straminea]|uniref:Uncharacterized protein n=1 Tax=Actinomycetospora straminea TaxID=663607 RepID=A0ABP9EZQ5_9PSEU|nr:hypothetical protein [Actinomycetospora straminea]MDD7932833.1 hypothetical protein [Actinomycetospora straminea]
MSGRSWRQLLVWLHVVSSVSWMSQAAALAVLLVTAIGPASVPVRVGAAQSAKLLDMTVLVYSANIATATGLLLAATTSWGFWLHRWVATKLVLTTGQLYLGIAVLSPRLDVAPATVQAGGTEGVGALALAATLMASAFAVQVWLSIAKPGGRTRRAARVTRPGTAPAWLFALAVGAPIAETVLGVAVTGPLPLLSLAVLVAALVVRRRAARRPPLRTAEPRPPRAAASRA